MLKSLQPTPEAISLISIPMRPRKVSSVVSLRKLPAPAPRALAPQVPPALGARAQARPAPAPPGQVLLAPARPGRALLVLAPPALQVQMPLVRQLQSHRHR